jgi:hypothetical protein
MISVDCEYLVVIDTCCKLFLKLLFLKYNTVEDNNKLQHRTFLPLEMNQSNYFKANGELLFKNILPTPSAVFSL